MRRAAKNGNRNLTSADHDSIEVMLDGDTARMIGCSRVIATVYNGGYDLGYGRFLSFYEGLDEFGKDQETFLVLCIWYCPQGHTPYIEKNCSFVLKEQFFSCI